MKSKIRIAALFLLAALFLTVSACGNNKSNSNSSTTDPSTEVKTVIDKDREGNPITLPDKIESIVVFGPSTTEILTALGCGDKIVAIDDYSSDVEGIKAGLPLFSMEMPDGEQILNLNPDIVFVTSMTKVLGEDRFKIVSDAGICVIFIPSSYSIEDIKEDVRFVADVMGLREKGNELVSNMESEIESIRSIGDSVTDKKKVYFELGAAPYMYSFGNGVYLNEMIEIIGAVNVMGDQESWISVADESVLNLNPDVILTTVNYIDDPIGEIMSRPGWNVITAVQNADIYYIDTNTSNRPNHNIVIALRAMAEAVYPDLY